MTDTVLNASSRLKVSALKPGISYLCSNCGTLLYHIGPEYLDSARPVPLRPVEVAERMKVCRECGHKLKSELERDIKIARSNSP